MTERRFLGKVALVTGGGSGIGRTTARAFAREGATVIVAARNQSNIEQTTRMIQADGGTASSVVTDVTSSADVEQLIQTIVERHGRLDIAFNNAGVFLGGPLHETDEAGWSHALDVNLTGVMLCMKHEINHMRSHAGGVIVNTASNIGPHLSLPGVSTYGATKAAVSALTRAAALEYIGEGIRINAVSPGMSDTSMSISPGETEDGRAQRAKVDIPVGRVGALEEIASAVLYLSSDMSEFVVGHDLIIDGGAAA